MKEKRIEKEIKKAQKKGIYNPKLKLGIVALILVIGTVIGVSYAYYTSNSSTVLNIKGTVSKKIMVRVEAGDNGKVNELDLATEQADYGTPTQSFKLTPDTGYQYKNVTCKETNNSNIDVTNKVSVSISNNTLRITPKTSKDITCKVEFERVRTLQEIVTEIQSKAKSTSPTSDNFSTGCPTNGDTTCSGVYKMKDDSNKDSYYFRGEAKDNYVQFGKDAEGKDLIWRIVRINGDGTIRLILNKDIGTTKFNDYSKFESKHVGYTYDNTTPCTNTSPCKSIDIATNVEKNIGTTDHGGENSTIKTKLEAWYYDNLKEYDDYIDYGIYCNDTSYGSGDETSYLYYGAYQRLQNSSKTVNPKLTCPDPKAESNASTSDVKTVNGTKYRTYGGVYKLKIGLLSADEIVLAGFKPNNNSPYVTNVNYLYYSSYSNEYFWSLSPSYSSTGSAYGFFGTLDTRYLKDNGVNSTGGVRPVINLKADNLKATGEGTSGNPFVIKTN